MDKIKLTEQFTQRKKDHIRLSLKKENTAIGGSGFQFIKLAHCSLPEMNFSEIDISTSVFSKKLTTPFVVTGMTAGWSGALEINNRIGKVCMEQGWVMGVGSQRRQIFDKKAGQEWREIRKNYPSLVLMGNIGLSQLIQLGTSAIEDLVLSLQAEAMVVHTNPLQEALQAEGTPQFKGGKGALRKLCKTLSVPVILKETGCGFSKKTLESLSGVGLFAVDISGYGGTHWGRIEGSRFPKDHPLYGTTEAFKDWGIGTVDSLLIGKNIKKDYKIWASGGITNGCDAAKALVLGADRVGMARPIIQEALKSEKDLKHFMLRTEHELKVAMFCSGCRNIKEMQKNKNWVRDFKPGV